VSVWCTRSGLYFGLSASSPRFCRNTAPAFRPLLRLSWYGVLRRHCHDDFAGVCLRLGTMDKRRYLQLRCPTFCAPIVCNRLPNFARLLGYNTLQNRRKHHSFSGNIQGDRKPLYPFSISLLSEISQLTDLYVLSSMSVPFLKEISHVQENPMQPNPSNK
jgi:hypothetical protein